MNNNKEIITLEDFDFKKINIGDLVEEKVVDYYINVLPPASMSSNCTQVGSPALHLEDVRDGKVKPVYATFERVDSNSWRYCGNCFYKETMPRGIEERYITLSDGTGMDGELLIFLTNAPATLLKTLEKLSCEAIDRDEDAPIWSNILKEAGYAFEYIDSHQHVTAYGTSTEWLMNHEIGSAITEDYTIERTEKVTVEHGMSAEKDTITVVEEKRIKQEIDRVIQRLNELETGHFFKLKEDDSCITLLIHPEGSVEDDECAGIPFFVALFNEHCGCRHFAYHKVLCFIQGILMALSKLRR